DLSGPGTIDRLAPCAERVAERRTPFVGRLQNDTTANAMDQHLALIVGEPNRFRKPDGLAAAVVEDLRSSRHAGQYRQRYIFRQHRLLAAQLLWLSAHAEDASEEASLRSDMKRT